MSDNNNFFQSIQGIVLVFILVIVSFGAGAMFMKLQNNSGTNQGTNTNDTNSNTNSNTSGQVAGATSNYELFEGYAKQIGLNTDDFKKCYSNKEMVTKIKADIADGSAVSGTPTFFVNGLKVEIDQTKDKSWFDALKRYIEAELNGSPLEGEKVEIAISDSDPQKGNLQSDIAVVEFSDFQCPYCASGGKPAAEQVIQAYSDKVKLVWKNYPLDQACNVNITQAFHANACEAAEAAMCANEQGKFWEMHDLIFDNQSVWSE